MIVGMSMIQALSLPRFQHGGWNRIVEGLFLNIYLNILGMEIAAHTLDPKGGGIPNRPKPRRLLLGNQWFWKYRDGRPYLRETDL